MRPVGGHPKKYRLLLAQRLVRFCEDRDIRTAALREIALDTLTNFRTTWAGAALTKSKTQERLRSFFDRCLKRKWIDENPADGLTAFQVDDAPTLPLEADEVTRILAACDAYSARGIYGHENHRCVKAFVLLLRWTGLRIRDVTTFEWKRLTGNRVFLRTQKTGQPVYVPVPPDEVGHVPAPCYKLRLWNHAARVAEFRFESRFQSRRVAEGSFQARGRVALRGADDRRSGFQYGVRPYHSS